MEQEIVLLPVNAPSPDQNPLWGSGEIVLEIEGSHQSSLEISGNGYPLHDTSGDTWDA